MTFFKRFSKNHISDWKHDLRTVGYHVFSQLTPQDLVTQASQAIQNDLQANYDKSRQVEYDHQSFCPSLRRNTVITDLIKKSPIRNILDEVVG